jgi:AcrR family transcriptional regulator
VEGIVSKSERVGGRERILAAALETLETEGEAAVRFVDVGKRAGVAISVITHHFGSREGLIEELHAHRFHGLVEKDLETLSHLSRTAKDRETYVTGLTEVTAQVVNTARHATRLTRIVSIGAAHGRPDLAGRIRREATLLLDQLTALFIAGQARGFLDRSIEPRAAATFLQAYALGMIIADLDETPVEREEIAALIDRFMHTLLDPA